MAHFGSPPRGGTVVTKGFFIFMKFWDTKIWHTKVKYVSFIRKMNRWPFYFVTILTAAFVIVPFAVQLENVPFIVINTLTMGLIWCALILLHRRDPQDTGFFTVCSPTDLFLMVLWLAMIFANLVTDTMSIIFVTVGLAAVDVVALSTMVCVAICDKMSMEEGTLLVHGYEKETRGDITMDVK